MNTSLNDLLNLIDQAISVPVKSDTITVKVVKKREKVDKNVINLVYSDNSPSFQIECGKCGRNLSWNDAARTKWIFLAKEMKYICTNCI